MDANVTTDAVGQQVRAGDFVAHVSRRGSHVNITKRLVHEVLPDGDVYLIPLSRAMARHRVYSHKLIKVPA